jgi:nucleoside-diphosphate-sugar epimerase
MPKSLITGAGGFIGANLTRRLLNEGDDVHVFVRNDKANWRLDGLEDKITLHTVDLTKKEEVSKAIKNINPDYVFHLATYGAYPSQKDTDKIIQTNLGGTINLVEALKASSIKRFVNVGSSSEYGAKAEPMRETDLLEPNTPYGVAKSAQTMFVQHCAKEKKFPAVMLRLLSVYGPYEEQGRLIPSLLTALAKNEAPQLSSPDPKRDFVYVGDVCDALVSAIKCGRAVGEIINIGCGKEQSVSDVANAAISVSGSQLEPMWGAVSGRAFDSARWVADISKAKDILKWEPKHSLLEGLQESYKWFQNNLEYYEKEG